MTAVFARLAHRSAMTIPAACTSRRSRGVERERAADALDITPSDLLKDVERRMLVQAKGRLSPQA